MGGLCVYILLFSMNRSPRGSKEDLKKPSTKRTSPELRIISKHKRQEVDNDRKRKEVEKKGHPILWKPFKQLDLEAAKQQQQQDRRKNDSEPQQKNSYKKNVLPTEQHRAPRQISNTTI